MLNKFLAFGFSCILTINSMFVVGSGVWDTLTNWGDTIARTYNNAVYNLLDHISGNDNILSPSNNNILSPTANYYTSTSNTTNNTIVHDQQTYNNTINYVYGGDTNYTNYYLTSNQYDNRYYYTIDNSNNYYSTDTYYLYEDTNYYYTSYYEYTNYTIVQIPKTNPNTIMSYKFYYQTPSGQNSYNLTPNDVYGLYLNGDIYNYNSEVDGDIIGLWHLDGNRVNEVPNSDYVLYYDGQTFVNSKFGSGLQTNGETKLTILGDQLPTEYSLRFWYYNADSHITSFPLNAWSCIDIVHTELNDYVWVNGIQKTFDSSDKFATGVFLNGSPVTSSGSLNISPSTPFPSDTLTYDERIYEKSYYKYNSYHLDGNDYIKFSYSPIVYSNVPKPTFTSDSITFIGTDSPISRGTNYSNSLSSYVEWSKSWYQLLDKNWAYTSTPTLSNKNNWRRWYSGDTVTENYVIFESYYKVYARQKSSSLPTISDYYWTVSNSIIDDIALYDGIQWLNGTNHISDIPTDPQEVGYIWSTPVGNFKKGDIAIKSDINVTGYRIGGAQPTPPYTGLLYINLDDNYYATDCKIYNGSTWIHIDFAVYNGASWISGYNYDFLNGFAYPPSDNTSGGGSGGGDNPPIDYPSSAINAISTLGQILQWIGAFVLVFPLLPLSFRIFLGGILILLGTLITYKFVKK